MKFLCKIFFVGSLLNMTPIFQALGGNKVGNGGDVIICEGKVPLGPQLLDFYEETIDFKSVETDSEKIANGILQKLSAVAPQLAKTYITRLQEFRKELDFNPEAELIDIEDSDHLFLPDQEKCKIKQIAIRKASAQKGEKRFLISNKLWKELTPIHQSGLLTHEIIYEHFAKLGELTSVKARKFNRFLYQREFNKKEFWAFMKDLEVPIYP